MSLGRTEAPLPLQGQESLEESWGFTGLGSTRSDASFLLLAEGAGGCQQPQPSSLRQPKGLFPLCTADLSWPDSLKYFTILQGISSLTPATSPASNQLLCSFPHAVIASDPISLFSTVLFIICFSLFRSQHRVFSQPAFPFLLPAPPCPGLEPKPPDPLLPGTRSASGAGRDEQEMGKGTVMAMLMAVASLSLQ